MDGSDMRTWRFLLVAAMALTACGTQSAGVVVPERINYDVGLYSVPAATSDSPGYSLSEVEKYVTQPRWLDDPKTPSKPEIDLRDVTQNGRTSLQWVIVWHHSKLTSRGPNGQYPDDQAANCDMVLMLDANTGAFTLQVQLCAPPPAGQALIDAGKMEPPLYIVTTPPDAA